MTGLFDQLPFGFEKPEWLWLALLIPVLVAASYRALAGLGMARRIASLVVRSLVILAIVATLAEIQQVKRNDDLTVMFLMDRSLSVREHEANQEAYMERVCEKIPPNDRVGVIDFARHAHLEQLPMKGGYFLERGRLPDMPNPDRTDVAGAVRLAMAMFPHDTAKRIVMISDGNDNMGDLLGEAQRAAADGVTIDVVPLWYELRREIFFEKMTAPASAEVGEIVAIRMNLRSNSVTSGRIEVYHNGQKLDLPDEMARKRLEVGNNSFVLKQLITEPGVQRFEGRFIPDNDDADAIAENNRASSFTFVSGKGKVALLTMDPSADQVLYDALRDENILIRMIDLGLGIPDLASLLDYSSIIMSNVPANVFTDEQQQALKDYVETTGGGLITTGGDESYGAGGWIGTSFADVLPVELELKHKKIIPRGALVLIMHSCELPRGNYWGKLVAKKSVDTISSQDYIGVVAYTAGGTSWEVPLQFATNKQAVKSRMDRMIIGDMPDFDASMGQAVKGLSQTDAVQRHIILISDGDAAAPSQRVMRNLISSKITCSTIAIGYGVHVQEVTLRDIAKRTGGRFYPVRNPRTLPQIFVKESKVVRRPLIVDEPFTPQVAFQSSEILAGIADEGQLPPLGGLVLTTPKGEAFVSLVRATEDGEDPVLVHWQRGLGRVVSFTSGYWPKWGADWTAWPMYSKLWAQITRWTMRQEAPANFDVMTRIEGNKARIIIEALDKNADYLNFLQLQSKYIDPKQGPQTLQFTQTGPGHYEAEMPIEHTGQYIASIGIFKEGDYQGSIHTGVSMPFSPELRETSTNEAMLREVVNVSAGRWLDAGPEMDDIFSHDLPPSVSKQPVWDWTLAWVLLPLFLLDVSVRRLASWLALSIVVELLIIVVLLFGAGVIYTNWFGVLGVLILAELVGWSIRYQFIRPLIDWLTHSVTALGHAGERSTQTLGQLKNVRERGKTDDVHVSQPQRPVESTPARTVKFDAGEPTPGTKVGDLSDVMGGAKASATEAGKPESTSPGDRQSGETEEAHMSRLLRAKRRARGKIDDGNKQE